MTYEELIEEAGAAIGIEGFAPDADGICTLISDIGEIVIMNCKGSKEMVLLNAAVTEVQPNAGATLLAALESNKGFKDTNGATLSVDPETHRFELSRYAFLEDLDPFWRGGGKSILMSLFRSVQAWREKTTDSDV